MKDLDNYTPRVGETVLLSEPNWDNEDGPVYAKFEILWLDYNFILYGNKNSWPNLGRRNHILIKKIEAVCPICFGKNKEDRENDLAIAPCSKCGGK